MRLDRVSSVPDFETQVQGFDELAATVAGSAMLITAYGTLLAGVGVQIGMLLNEDST